MKPQNTQAKAAYRVALKRIIRAAVGQVNADADTGTLETLIRQIVITSPAVVARGLEGWFEMAAKEWERGNNSGSNYEMSKSEKLCEDYRQRAERILKLWGVQVDYPGLYPSFTWRGGDYHSCQSLLIHIAKAEKPTEAELDEFTRGYIECALWSSMDLSNESGGEPLDKNYSAADIAQETAAKMGADCRKFQAENREMLALAKYSKNDITDSAHAGHDFWLTRCGHGAGFWDGDLAKDVGNALTAASKKFKEVDLYVGDDGKIYD